jgi:5-methylcytosine-specific restriction endonuclease McrA
VSDPDEPGVDDLGGVGRGGPAQRRSRSMDVLFQKPGGQCRVCTDPVVDHRWEYCSKRCRRIAVAVFRMFQWPSVRHRVFERDDYTCQSCGYRAEEAFAPDDLHADHITPLRDGGHPFEERNHQTLCADCHTEKTAQENADRDSESAAEGDPSVKVITMADYLPPEDRDT